MSETTKHVSSRREFLKDTGRIAAVTTLAGLAVPRVFAAEDNTIQVVSDRLRWTRHRRCGGRSECPTGSHETGRFGRCV